MLFGVKIHEITITLGGGGLRLGIDKFERYIELSDGAERINHSELMKDLSEIRGFRASERQRAQYDRVMEWFRLRGRSKNAVTF